MLQNGRLIPVLVVVGVLASGLALMAGANSSTTGGDRVEKSVFGPPPSQPVAAAKNIMPVAYQQLTKRNLEIVLPDGLPISVRLKPEKEESFSNLKNEKWVHDFELEVKNKGTKPIYFLRFSLVPDLNTPPGERALGLVAMYGRAELLYPDEPATPQDRPIQPNEKVIVKILDEDATGWDYFVKLEKWPEHKSKPQKATLYFEMLSYGDGTGISSAEEQPFSVPKRDKPRPPSKKPPGEVNYAHPVKRAGPWRKSETESSPCKVLAVEPSSANAVKDNLVSPKTATPLITLTSLTNSAEPFPVCNCNTNCRYVSTQITRDCDNCISNMHAFNENCIQAGSCKLVRENIRRCYVTEGDFKFWVGCPYDIVSTCPTGTPTPTPTPSPTPTPTPTPIPCPFTSAANCPNGVPRDPCTYDTEDVPPDFRTGCPILSVPSLDGLCCIQPCLAQPSPPQCPGGPPTWIAEPTCMWQCPEVGDPDPGGGENCLFDPCCDDPICCGDLCCLDPCCGDPSCGLECFEYCYSACAPFCGVYDIYNEECIYWEWNCDTYCDVYCY